MNTKDLERKPHNEWTEEEIKFWLSEYAKEEIMKDAAFEVFN